MLQIECIVEVHVDVSTLNTTQNFSLPENIHQYKRYEYCNGNRLYTLDPPTCFEVHKNHIDRKYTCGNVLDIKLTLSLLISSTSTVVFLMFTLFD